MVEGGRLRGVQLGSGSRLCRHWQRMCNKYVAAASWCSATLWCPALRQVQQLPAPYSICRRDCTDTGA
jgi:hypothetical protein